MIRDNINVQAAIDNGAFNGFVFATVGWALLHLWGYQVGAGAAMHAITALGGLILAAIAFRRYKRYWLCFSSHAKPTSQTSHLGWSLLLILIGYVLGQLVLVGLVIPLAIFSIGLTFVPWSRVQLCRIHFFAACAIIGTSVTCTLLAAGSASAPTIVYPIAAWVFWTSACFALLRKF